MATHSSTLAWKIPWAEEPCRLQSMGSRRIGHDWATSLSLFTSMHWRRKWQPTPVFLPGESQGWWSLVSCHLWGAQSRTWLKQLSNSSRHYTIPHSIIHLLSPNFCSLFQRLDTFYWLTFNSALNSSFSKNNFQVIAKISYLLTQCIHLFMQVLKRICNVF